MEHATRGVYSSKPPKLLPFPIQLVGMELGLVGGGGDFFVGLTFGPEAYLIHGIS